MELSVYKKLNVFSKIIYVSIMLFVGIGSSFENMYLISFFILILLIYQIYTIIAWVMKKPILTINSTEIVYGRIKKLSISVSSITDIQLIHDRAFGKRLIVRYKSNQLRQLFLTDVYSLPLEEINSKLLDVCGDDIELDGSIMRQNKEYAQGPKYFVAVLYLLQLLLIFVTKNMNALIISHTLYTVIVIVFIVIGLVTHYVFYRKKDEKYTSFKLAIVSWIVLLLILFSSILVI